MGTAIAWTDETWNPTTGCSKVSPGCANCYAERLSLRFGWSEKPWTPENAAENVVLHPERLEIPLRWRKPRMIFVDSMSDLFHEEVPIEFIRAVFYVMEYASQHTFQILTKRPERARDTWREYLCYPLPEGSAVNFKGDAMALWLGGKPVDISMTYRWPSNVWLGVSVENQRMADERIPLLLDTPAAVRFLSVEPLLGPVDLRTFLPATLPALDRAVSGPRGTCIDWVIVGGESGGPEHRRLVDRVHECIDYDLMASPPSKFGYVWKPKPDALSWVRSLRDQCVAAGTPHFFKQWGGPKPTSGGRELDGRTWDEMPQRQAPERAT